VKLARTIRFDESDGNVFDPAATSGEWAVSGAFAFSDIAEADLTGKTRQAFANGWLGLDSFGRATFVAVAEITQAERDACAMRLAAHFVSDWGAPSLEAALPVAEAEVAYMAELCAEHRPNTLLVVERSLETDGVREAFRVIEPAEATIIDVLGPEAAMHAHEKMRGG
jgi:hypothetical protein